MANLIETAPTSGLPAGAQSVIATEQELPSPIPLMALSTGFWAFKTLAAAHEFDLFTRLSKMVQHDLHRAGSGSRNLSTSGGNAADRLCGTRASGEIRWPIPEYADRARHISFAANPITLAAGSRWPTSGSMPGWGKLTEALRTNRPTTWDPSVHTSLFDAEDPKMLALFWGGNALIVQHDRAQAREAVDFEPLPASPGHRRRVRWQYPDPTFAGAIPSFGRPCSIW